MSRQSEITCACGETSWIVKDTGNGRHLMCYCADCQSFSRHLGQEDRHLDKDGTRIFQTHPGNVEFTKGKENLALLRLSPKGTFRWYAKCCNAPIANTMANTQLPFAGMVLPKDNPDFGPVRTRFFSKYTEAKVKDENVLPAMLSMLTRAAVIRITGGERKAPFFTADDQPVAEPTVLTLDQRKAAQSKS